MLISFAHSLMGSDLRKILGSMAGERGRRVMRRLQDAMLRQEVAYAAAHSPFYRQRFAECGVDPKAIRRVSDLAALGFFTYPSDLAAGPYRFRAVPQLSPLIGDERSYNSTRPCRSAVTTACVRSLAWSLPMMVLT